MKIKKYVLFIIVALFVIFLFGFSNKVYAMDANNECQENELTEMEIINSLNSLLQKYMCLYELEEEQYHDETIQKIQVLSNYICLKEHGHNSQSEENSHDDQNRSGAFNISPNCTCNLINYLTDTPCANCQYYSSVLDGVYAVLAGFYIRGWNLAADLLAHNLSNTILDSDYYPSADLISVISQSSQIDRIRYDDKLSDGFKQDDPGWANGIFANTADGDVFNALGKFYYTKNYYSNGYIEINILDRYDWERGTGSPGGVLINNMVAAQELGILTPFYTCIEIITAGFSAFSWDYYLDGVIVNDYHGSGSTISLPIAIYDLRYHQQDMIYAYVTSIANYAFQFSVNVENAIIDTGSHLENIGVGAFYSCTSLESIIIPASVFSVGAHAFRYCSSLESVTILKETAPITNLGLHAFDNCASNLTIIVPINRLCQYKNTPLWSIYKNKIVPSSNIDSSINIDCMSNFDETVYLNAGYNKLYELNVECNGWYTISCSSGARFNIYNSNMEIIASSNNLYELTLSEGIYYIDVEWEDIEDYGNVTLHFYNKGISVTDNINNNILPHLHSTGTNYKAQLKYYHNQGAGYYKFSLSATSSTSDPVNYHYGAITMYTDYNRNTIMNKYSDNNYTLQAKSLEDENSMIIYLPSNGYYYFDVNMGTNNLSSLVLNITSSPFSEMNLFDFNVSANDTETVIDTNIEGDYFKKISLKQTGKFIISSTYTDNDIDNISLTDVVVVVSKVTYNPSTNTYSFTKIYSVDYRETIMLDPNYVLPLPLEIVLEAGTYYIGYFNNIDCANIKIDFERIITGYGSYNLITDPDMYNDYGSEVRFNNGAYLGTTLTVGFTRFIYLNWDYNLPSYSRLDYYFYSSNETIASISEYGTLLGKSAGSIKIMAVYKNNPSITFVKQFTVLTDNRLTDLIINNTDNCYYAESGQSYQVDLTDTNSFFPQNTLYNWNIVSSNNNYNYNISEWGTLSLNGDDIIVIEGVSKLNSKLKIRLTLTVT